MLPWPRSSATGLSPSTFASAAPCLMVVTSKPLVMPGSRISNTGQPQARNDATLDTARSGSSVPAKGITGGRVGGEVELHNVGCGNQCRRARPRDQVTLRILRVPHRDVPPGVEHA